MIHDLKNAAPSITFGFGALAKEVAAGEPATVWLSTLYNQDAYVFSLQCEGAVQAVSNYEYEVTFSTAGTYSIQLLVSTKTKGASLQSNILTLTVI
jgi:hypothetical protein